jgi:hypothetical protein
LVKKHQNLESITSLASIPEAEGSWHSYTMGSKTAASFSSSIAPSIQTSIAPHLTLLHQSKASLDLSLWSEALLSGLARSAELNLGFTTIHEDEKERKNGKDRDFRDEDTENGMFVKGPEKEKNENGLESPLTTAKPFGPAQTMNMTRNVSAAGTTRRQQPAPTTARHPLFARPNLPFNNNNASSSTSSLVGHPHYHHGYGQSPKPPPAVPLPPPPPSASNIPSTNNNNNTIPVSSVLMTRRGVLPPSPSSVPIMFSPPSTAGPQEFEKTVFGRSSRSRSQTTAKVVAVEEDDSEKDKGTGDEEDDETPKRRPVSHVLLRRVHYYS